MTVRHTIRTLTARYREALALHEAWTERARESGGTDRVAAVLQRDDAWSWVLRTKQDLDHARAITAPGAFVAPPGPVNPSAGIGVGSVPFAARRNAYNA